MKSRLLLRIVAPLALLASTESAVAATLLVTKSASCGCCEHWVEHMKKAGFAVQVHEVDDVHDPASTAHAEGGEPAISPELGDRFRRRTLRKSVLEHG